MKRSISPLKVILQEDYSADVFAEMLRYGDFNCSDTHDKKMAAIGVVGYAYLFEEMGEYYVGWSGDYEDKFIHSKSYYEDKASYRTISSKDFLDLMGQLKDKDEPWVPRHKEPIWCWNNTDHTSRELRFWDEVSKRAFSKNSKQLNVIKFDNYDRVENPEPWMLVIQSEIEDLLDIQQENILKKY